MRQWIRRWLGLNDICAQLYCIEDQLNDFNTTLKVLSSGVGRLITKFDPLFGIQEDDPNRASKIEAIIGRLLAEEKIRRPHTVDDL